MASDEWRMCVDWLVRCRILPEDHRATRPDSEAFDLAQALRDGVLICHLLNSISPGVIDSKDFAARPQLSQFLCLKNIRTFLQTCKREFGLRDQDLFDPPDLFDVKDFRKVLRTLSRLSKTEIAQSKFSAGFRSQNKHIAGPDYYNLLEDLANDGFPPENTGTWRGRHHDDEEDIYGNLPDMALENDLDDNEEIYDRVYQEDDEEIYEDLCSSRRSKRVSGTPASELPSPVTKKDHCIKELYDTEKNYVDALKMLVQHFIKPLRDVIPQQERDIIFAHIEKLLEVHKSFLTEIQLACVSGSVKLYDVFIKHKTKLLLYGDYCSNLPIAQEKIDEVLKKGEGIRIQIEACEKKANEGKFRLRDLLHVPMQRVLKYHLLLKELLKTAEKQSEEHRGLEMALEAMQDLSLYVNEVKRDNETLQLINEIQNSIGDLQMPPNTSLKDYGRLQKDGELKVKNHTDNRLRSRYIFLFDKVMLMCKSKGETYNFKEAIILSEYKVHDAAALKELQKKVDKWNCAFIMAKKNDKNAYTFYAKTEDMRLKWMEAIKLALDNTEIPAGTNYVMHTFEKPTECNVCGKLLRGVFFQGYQCQETKVGVHKECIGKSPAEKSIMPPVPPRIHGPKSVIPSRLNLRSSESTKKSSIYRSQVRALVDYTGKPPPGAGRAPLKFHKDDVIKILDNSDSQWWKGHLHGEEGWFPQHLVQEEQVKVQRKPSYLPVKLKTESNGTMSPPTAHHPSTNNIGYVNVPDEESLNKYKWFVGHMDRDTAVRRLNNLSNGTFLIRVSKNPGRVGELSLSIKYDNQTRHIRVERNTDNRFFLADTKFFHSLPELVKFYEVNSLADSFPGVDTVLKYPVKAQSGFTGPNCKILGYCLAMYDYAATATSQLSLTRGDRVAIMSKTGSDKGWWKGEHCATGKMGYFPLAYVREEDDD